MKKILILSSVLSGFLITTQNLDAWPFAKKATVTSSQTIAPTEAASKGTPSEQEKTAGYMAEKSQEMKTQIAKKNYEKELKEDKAANDALVKAQSDVVREQQETAAAKLTYETEEAKLAKIQTERSAATTLKTEQKVAADKAKLETKVQNLESKNASKQIELQLSQMRDLFKTKNKIANPFSKELKAYDEKVKIFKQSLTGQALIDAVKTIS